MSYGKSKTMPMQIFGRLKRCIMGFVQVVNMTTGGQYKKMFHNMGKSW